MCLPIHFKSTLKYKKKKSYLLLKNIIYKSEIARSLT